jgi:hypothetical protein
MSIANVSELAEFSDYVVEAMEARNDLAGLPSRTMSASVEDHNRRQSVWALVARAAAAIAQADSDPH